MRPSDVERKDFRRIIPGQCAKMTADTLSLVSVDRYSYVPRTIHFLFFRFLGKAARIGEVTQRRKNARPKITIVRVQTNSRLLDDSPRKEDSLRFYNCVQGRRSTLN